MNALRLDYQVDPNRAGWAACVLLVVAVAFAGDVGYTYWKTSKTLEQKKTALATIQQARGKLPDTARMPGANDKTFARELATAREIILRIALPWNALFKRLEAIQSPDIGLVSLEPDPDNHILLLSGEARDYPAVLTYVGRMEATEGFSKVGLTRHEIKQNEPQRPIVFSLSTSWKARP